MPGPGNGRTIRKRKFKARGGAELAFTELGFGAAPLGNLYRPMTEKEARATLDMAWTEGCRYYDTAPLYGLGLSETRINGFLRAKPRDSYILSTKVGRLLQLCPPAERRGRMRSSRRRRGSEVFDYSRDGVLRSHRVFAGAARARLISTSSTPMTSTCSPTAAPEAADARIREFMSGGYRALVELARAGRDQGVRRRDQRMGDRRAAGARGRFRRVPAGRALHAAGAGGADELPALLRRKDRSAW